MGKTGPFTHYHVKNRPLMNKKPKGCNGTKGRTIDYSGRNIKIVDCSPEKRGRGKGKGKKKK